MLPSPRQAMHVAVLTRLALIGLLIFPGLVTLRNVALANAGKIEGRIGIVSDINGNQVQIIRQNAGNREGRRQPESLEGQPGGAPMGPFSEMIGDTTEDTCPEPREAALRQPLIPRPPAKGKSPHVR